MRGYLTLVLLLVGSLLSTTSQADHGIRVCQHAVQKYAYRLELAELILARTAAQYGENHIHPSTLPDPAQERCLNMLREGQVDLAFVPPSAERLRDFAVIPFDLHNGMLGYRVLLIRKTDAERFTQVNTLADLRQLRGGFGSQWSDFSLFARNQLPVEGLANPDNLLAMLGKRRFDYYHRGLHEAWRELDENPVAGGELMVEPHLALVYHLPVYFTFNRHDQPLKRRFEQGLALIQADGSLQALFSRHFGQLATQAGLEQRTLIPLDYPNPPGLPAPDTHLWLQRGSR